MLYTLKDLDTQEEIIVTVNEGVTLVNQNNCNGFIPYTRYDWLDWLHGLYIITGIDRG